MTLSGSNFIALLRGLGRLGPWGTLVLVAGVAILAPQPPTVDATLLARYDTIRRVLEGVPLRCGEWIGEEQPLPPAAVELLRPNASLCRMYRRIGSDDRALLSVIHCSDARDMAGHYPPICYPAHGWSLGRPWLEAQMPGLGGSEAPKSGEFESMDLLLADGRRVPLRLYRFSRAGEGLTEIKMSILSAFILPDGEWTPDLSVVRDVQSRRRATREGVAQIQVVFGGWPATEMITEPAISLLSSLPPEVFDVLGERQDPGTEVRDE